MISEPSCWPSVGRSDIRILSCGMRYDDGIKPALHHSRILLPQRLPAHQHVKITDLVVSVLKCAGFNLTCVGTCASFSDTADHAGSMLKSWLGREGSNLRMPESKSGALPLGDAPICVFRADRKPHHLRNTLQRNAPIAASGGPSNRLAQIVKSASLLPKRAPEMGF